MNPEQSLVQPSPSAASIYASGDSFMMAQRMAQSLAASSMVPEAYRGQNGLANCIVALELANRLNTSPLMVMQNVHVVQGRPMWSSQFLIGLVNSSGRYTPLRFIYDKEDEPTSCYAVATDKASGEVLRGTKITLDMAQREGWSTKNGSKWKTMPAQMMMYRAASFWTRAYAPDLTLGIRPQDEVTDIEEVTVTTTIEEAPAPAPPSETLTKALAAAAKATTPEAREAIRTRAMELAEQGAVTAAERDAILRAAAEPEAVPEPAPEPTEPPTAAPTLDDIKAASEAVRQAGAKGSEALRSIAEGKGMAPRSPIAKVLTSADDIKKLMEALG